MSFGDGAVVDAAHQESDIFEPWQRQKNEECRIELAEQLLTLAYKLRRAIESIHSPWRSDRQRARRDRAGGRCVQAAVPALFSAPRRTGAVFIFAKGSDPQFEAALNVSFLSLREEDERHIWDRVAQR